MTKKLDGNEERRDAQGPKVSGTKDRPLTSEQEQVHNLKAEPPKVEGQASKKRKIVPGWARVSPFKTDPY